MCVECKIQNKEKILFIQKDEILPFVIAWMKQDDIILSETSQAQK
jgi:hypothetical protein